MLSGSTAGRSIEPYDITPLHPPSGAAGAPPVDHADPRALRSVSMGPRDRCWRLRQRAEDTGPRGAPPRPRSATVLFHSDGLGEIARLVHVSPETDRDVVGQELERDGHQ